MEPADGMTEVFRKNKRGVAVQHTPRIHRVRIYLDVSTNIISNSCEKIYAGPRDRPKILERAPERAETEREREGGRGREGGRKSE